MCVKEERETQSNSRKENMGIKPVNVLACVCLCVCVCYMCARIRVCILNTSLPALYALLSQGRLVVRCVFLRKSDSRMVQTVPSLLSTDYSLGAVCRGKHSLAFGCPKAASVSCFRLTQEQAATLAPHPSSRVETHARKKTNWTTRCFKIFRASFTNETVNRRKLSTPHPATAQPGKPAVSASR